jgi:hypothetical protein
MTSWTFSYGTGFCWWRTVLIGQTFYGHGRGQFIHSSTFREVTVTLLSSTEYSSTEQMSRLGTKAGNQPKSPVSASRCCSWQILIATSGAQLELALWRELQRVGRPSFLFYRQGGLLLVAIQSIGRFCFFTPENGNLVSSRYYCTWVLYSRVPSILEQYRAEQHNLIQPTL